MKRLKYLLALCAMVIIPLVATSNSYAVSDYDDVITSPGQLKLSYPGYDDMDITTSYMNYIMGSITDGVRVNECDSSCKDIVNNSLDHGDWSINQVYSNYPGDNYSVQAYFCDQEITSTSFYTNHYGSTTEKSIYSSTTTPANCVTVRVRFQSVINGGHIFIDSIVYNNATTNVITVADKWANASGVISLSSQPFIYTGAFTPPEGYEGEIPEYQATDNDGDGLNETQEQAQGTSDTDGDTDGDGINDLMESVWYPNRDDVFCGSSACAYPDPAKKDLYVEVDWMKEADLFGRSFKPSTTQLGYVTNAYAAQGINAHFDTGQYGGGNELPTYVQNLHFEKDASNFDFYDYKNGTSTTSANFGSNRYHIWHYMITGYEYADITGSSGVSYFSDDDAFISSGLIEDNPGNDFTYSNIDYAIAGTILHELGHNLCLNDKTTTLHSECYSSYIDSYSAPSAYNSVMNYSYQMSNLLDYSSGANGSSDHNDWGAVSLGFADFVSRDQGDQTSAGKGVLRVGISRSQAKQLRKEHRIFSHVDESRRSLKRQVFDARRMLELNKR